MKKTLLITSIVLLTTVCAKAQSVSVPTLTSAPIIRFFPNPASSIVNFDFQKAYEKGYTLQVYSFLGKKMYEKINVDQRTSINLSEYNRGVYIYQLRNKAGKMVESGKFQVSK
ncbi:MAG: T9SS type A sorting domain-containing protein [Chitinophagaceae bacterium]